MSSQSSPRIFYGWAVVAFTFAVQFVTIGTVFYAYGVLLKPLPNNALLTPWRSSLG
jgi:hypothetical protein